MDREEDIIENLIIGAGPAGLAVAGRLRHAGKDFVILEKGHHVGERWHGHYDRLHLHSVKKWSQLPFLPFPDDYPVYVPRQKLIDYFENYATHFNIQPRLGSEVRHIRQSKPHVWEVTTNTGSMLARNLILATGVNRVPNLPLWEGIDQFVGTIKHSVEYKNPNPYRGSRVLVIGMGNTGAEIALDLSEAGIPVWLAVRGEVNIVPRDLNGRPVQETAKMMSKLPFGFGDWLGAQIQKLYFGNLEKYGLKRSKIPPAIALRTTGKTPMIDIGTVKAIKEGRIQVVGGIRSFETNGVVLDNGQQLACEHVILATGYRPQLQDLVEGIEPFLDKYGCPINPVGIGAFAGLYFVGFDNYKLGGILGTIYNDSGLVLDDILKSNNP